MTQKDKELLLKDLCARLPYGVKAFAKTHKGNKIGKVITITTKFIDYSKGKTILGELYTDDECFWLDYGLFKPYLRPMSSMTEEEKKKLKEDTCPKGTGYFDDKYLICPINHYGEHISYEFMSAILEWLNAHHFDYRGLIPMGLALEAPEGMYNTKTE